MAEYKSVSGSSAEDLFINLFADTFGVEKAGYLYSQYPFFDIYQNSRFADFVLENGAKRIAIEIDDEASHNPRLVSKDKYCDDLLKQNSMIHLGWDVYRWTVRQMQKQPDTVKDELKVFIGSDPRFKEIDDYLPTQRGQAFSGEKLELREYQQEALNSLSEMRAKKETIALLYHATGTGKTVTAVMDAKRCGGRALFVAHTMELVNQAFATFEALWDNVSVGKFADSIKDTESHVVCGSIQSVALNLEIFKDDDFDYIIIDEAHHASADTYQKVLAYFKPKFILGLTATPERADDTNILEIFKNTAHKLDIQTAVEIGALVPVRCIRIHTNIDMTKVRFNSVQYNIRDLDVKICVTERNKLIVDTWLEYVKNRRTVVFCASVKHAEQIAQLFKDADITAVAVSGSMKTSERNEQLSKFANGDTKVLCACDLLNEGWDCPQTEVLFMARPTMSKVLYTQQLGRGMRNSEGKDHLMVFDFVDNASQYNAPYSMHRLFKLKDYHAGGTVLGKKGQREAELELYTKGERPDAVVDYPVHATDYELVDIFNWQEEAANMYSQLELLRHLSINSSRAIDKKIEKGEIAPDLVVQMSENRTLHYYNKERVQEYASKFGWTVIDDDNKYKMFMDMVKEMRMDHSYKPVLLKALLNCSDSQGRAKISDLVEYFRNFYSDRKNNNLIVEKEDSLFFKDCCSDKEIEREILNYPFRRFETMSMMHHTKTLGVVQIDSCVWKALSEEEKHEIIRLCDTKLEEYYKRIHKKVTV
ncbi:MAG: DEAD/DEAH box helicase family protein [Clostridia bacterium]|nr:DEAD/DEAH box helicase family protein [Clostridia bacterium]